MKNESIASKTEAKEQKIELKFGKKFITKSLRSQNYDLETALSELIDNSIDAESDNIEIIYPSKTERKNSELIAIKDDGKGMSREELINAMTLGSDRDYDNTEIGYFGIGMKAALAYLSENVTIKTKRKYDKFTTTLIWNIDEGTSFTIQEDKTSSDESGTTILINPGHRYDYYSHTQESIIIKKFGGRYFHLLYSSDEDRDKYKKQVKIKINDTIISPTDPMYRNGIDSNKTLSQLLEDVTWVDKNGNEFVIRICGYYLKNYEWEPNLYDTKAGRNGLSTERSGVYVLLNNKYINLGGTFLGAGKVDPHLNYLRIELSIPKESTEYFGISMNKNSSMHDIFADGNSEDAIKDKIKKSIYLLRSWGLKLEEAHTQKRNLADPTQKKDTEKISNQLNNEFKSKGITKTPLNIPEISENIPVIKSKNEKSEPKGTKDRPDNLQYDKNLFDINLFNGGENDEFWDIGKQGTKLILRLNTEHIFYKEFISNSSDIEKKKIYKLLFSLAWAQLESHGGLYDFNDQINGFWNDFWYNSSKALKRFFS
jgi:predicted DNA-binding protein YlxM (UPF0122 family)/anti-sigma regulatory factor (Ser/Thr protein kinase)